MTPEEARALKEQGFVVLRGYFTPEELAPVLADYRQRRAKVDPKEKLSSYGGEVATWLRFDAPQMAHLRERLAALVKEVNGKAGLLGDLFPGSIGNYVPTSRVDFSPHVDFGADFQTQGTQNCWKAWIPIIKPRPDRAGITFARMDALAAREPDFAARIRDRGAVSFKDARKAVLAFGERKETCELSAPLDELLETPDCTVGDVVLFRSDTIHATQKDSRPSGPDDERVAWAVTFKWSGKHIERRDLYLNPAKRALLGRMGMAAQMAAFWYYGKARITFGEYLDFEVRARKKQPRALAAFCGAFAVEPLVSWVERRKRPAWEG